LNASDASLISIDDELAAAASSSTTKVVSLAWMPNALTALAAIVAASPSEMLATRASCNVACAASIDCCTVNPALASSVIAAAAPAAETPGSFTSAPSARALSATSAICLAVAPLTVLKMLRLFS
jgi:hypothetical protein